MPPAVPSLRKNYKRSEGVVEVLVLATRHQSLRSRLLSIPAKMSHTQLWLQLLATMLFSIALRASQALGTHENSLKSAAFLSPPFFLQPGSVVNKYYYNIDYPRNHIALKSFTAEVVDETGVSIPLHETYLHHWIVERYYGLNGAEVPTKASDGELHLSKFIPVSNSGICKGVLGQYFGLGSETRRTATWVPDPYGIEVGNPAKIPDGYEERWLVNVHAIDSRGVEDRLGCTECKCSVYNVTKDEFGEPLRKDYTGGLYCCYDQTQCRVREGFESVIRKLYLRYTVKWVDWDDNILPVRIYILDVTDSGKRLTYGSTEGNGSSSCKVEYQVKSCSLTGKVNGKCVDTKMARLVIPRGGDIVYGVGHQHTGGAGAALYGQDGRVLCTSIPTYGEGRKAGNEAGYIVGMSTCYPSPGSVQIADGEVLTLVSNYSNNQMHHGVMGLFHIFIADPQPKAKLFTASGFLDVMKLNRYVWGLVLLCATVLITVAVGYRRKKNEREGYRSLVI